MGLGVSNCISVTYVSAANAANAGRGVDGTTGEKCADQRLLQFC